MARYNNAMQTGVANWHALTIRRRPQRAFNEIATRAMLVTGGASEPDQTHLR